MANDHKQGREQVAGSIRAAIARARLTQVQIAAALGMGQDQVSRRVNGYIDWSPEHLLIVAGLVGVTVSELVGETSATERAS